MSYIHFFCMCTCCFIVYTNAFANVGDVVFVCLDFSFSTPHVVSIFFPFFFATVNRGLWADRRHEHNVTLSDLSAICKEPCHNLFSQPYIWPSCKRLYPVQCYIQPPASTDKVSWRSPEGDGSSSTVGSVDESVQEKGGTEVCMCVCSCVCVRVERDERIAAKLMSALGLNLAAIGSAGCQHFWSLDHLTQISCVVI